MVISTGNGTEYGNRQGTVTLRDRMDCVTLVLDFRHSIAHRTRVRRESVHGTGSAPGRTRTLNRPGRNRLLYPLSYGRQGISIPKSHAVGWRKDGHAGFCEVITLAQDRCTKFQRKCVAEAFTEVEVRWG